ncbi:hypothetical protein Pcinc_023448 [Petrolisthes cinctipes]|uniref:RRM domain-containing protein n=1 Tax=Petrolisthes cinctipes TaxID=88211 RepID=A0AAE1FEC8_PETCI|nr:hypothetical protein Pcinc_023448 [Petrolisthes cinctipes]
MDSESFVSNWNRANEVARKVMEETGCEVLTVRRQRIYTPSRDPPPTWGCEVFLYNLPQDVFEDELLPVVEDHGRLHHLRLPMYYSGRNRSFAFVTYSTPKEAKSAIKMLNGYEIRPGRYIKAIQSKDNRTLYVGGIPKEWTRKRVEMEVLRACVGMGGVPVAGVIVPNTQTSLQNRGYAFIEYDNHFTAANARRKFLNEKLTLSDSEPVEVIVAWALPKWRKSTNNTDNDKVGKQM